MFDFAYGLGCDSEDLPILVRLQKMIDAAIYAANPSSFLVVSSFNSQSIRKLLNSNIFSFH
jgi:hypothetical protein